MPFQSNSFLEVHQCMHCGLTQFRTVTGLCRRCRLPLTRQGLEPSPAPSIGVVESSASPLPKRIGNAVRRLRKERKLNEERLAMKIGTARS
jgi:hypothetical protein